MTEGAGEVDRVVLCSGKIYYDLLTEADKMDAGRPALVRLEQLYSFPWTEMRASAGPLSQAEGAGLGPGGAAEHGRLVLRRAEAPGAGASRASRCRYVGRPERASPAEGYPAAHSAEQSRIIREALETRGRPEQTAAHGRGGG